MKKGTVLFYILFIDPYSVGSVKTLIPDRFPNLKKLNDLLLSSKPVIHQTLIIIYFITFYL